MMFSAGRLVNSEELPRPLKAKTMGSYKELICEFCDALTAGVEPIELRYSRWDQLNESIIEGHQRTVARLHLFHKHRTQIRRIVGKLATSSDPQKIAEGVRMVWNAIDHCAEPEPLWAILWESLDAAGIGRETLELAGGAQ